VTAYDSEAKKKPEAINFMNLLGADLKKPF
jgi:hypothetical protein